MLDAASKALAQVVRYARLQTVITQRRRIYGRLFDSCDRATCVEDEPAGSGCMADLKTAKSNNDKAHWDERLSFWELVDECEFCPRCRIALRVLRHNRETLAKRRGSLLAAMRRLGTKEINHA